MKIGYFRSPPDAERGGSALPAETPSQESGQPEAGAKESPGAKPGEASPSAENAEGSDAKPPSMKEALAKALEGKDPSSDPAKDGQPPKDPKAKLGDDPAKPEIASEKANIDKHPRFQEIKRERDAFEPDAQEYRKISVFMNENGLNQADVADALKLHALILNDPEAAREAYSGIVEALDKSLGNKLSPELQAKVDDGALTEEAALELSRARAVAARSDKRASSATAETEAVRTEQQHKDFVKDVRDGTAAWEVETAKGDPDFAMKKGHIGVNIRAILQARGEGYKDRADAVAVCKRAYGMTNDFIKSLTPAPQKRNGHLTSELPSGGNNAPAPKTLKEAMGAAL